MPPVTRVVLKLNWDSKQGSTLSGHRNSELTIGISDMSDKTGTVVTAQCCILHGVRSRAFSVELPQPASLLYGEAF